MTIAPSDHPVIDRPDSAVAVVEEVFTDGPGVQERVAAAVVRVWRSAAWPAGLLARSVFTSSDGLSLLTYTQWSADGDPDSAEPLDWPELGIQPGRPQSFELYRVVHPAERAEPIPVPRCFPAAVFPLPGKQAAQEWVDGLLDYEVRNEGAERAYPGAVAANFHVGPEGVFLISEWVSEAEALVHIKEVIEPLLEYAGHPGAGRRYVFHTSVIPG